MPEYPLAPNGGVFYPNIVAPEAELPVYTGDDRNTPTEPGTESLSPGFTIACTPASTPNLAEVLTNR